MLPWHQKKEYAGIVLHNKSSVITRSGHQLY